MGSPYRSEETDPRKLERDPAPARRVRRAAAATALIGASIGATTPMVGLGAAALGGGMALLGLLLLQEAADVTMKAPCPSCSAPIHDIDPAVEVVPCPACGEHARVKDGGLLALRDEFVASAPVFAIPATDAAPVLPPICAECGAPGAERLVPIEALGQAGATVLLVPHCTHHADGAAASFATLRVRSHAFWLATRSARRQAPASYSGRSA